MKKILLILLMVVLTIGVSVPMFMPVMANSNTTVVSDTSVQIVGVYNEAGGTSSFVNLSGSPLNAVIADEPWLYTPGGDPGSHWDVGTGNFFDGTGAGWIWETTRSEYPATVYAPGDPLYDADASINGRVVVFQKTFDVSDSPQYAALHIAADNCYEVWLNGTWIVRSATAPNSGWETSNLYEASVNSNGWQTVGHYTDLAQYLVNGTNTLKIVVGNEYYAAIDGNSDNPYVADPYSQGNPGALIFKLDVESVVPPVPELPAGLLLGLGLVGIAGIGWFAYRRNHASAV